MEMVMVVPVAVLVVAVLILRMKIKKKVGNRFFPLFPKDSFNLRQRIPSTRNPNTLNLKPSPKTVVEGTGVERILVDRNASS